MIEFETFGPVEIPVEWMNNSRRIAENQLNDFWRTADEQFHEELGRGQITNRNGVYIFGMRSRGLMPWYVGKTWIGFRNEAFNAYQLNRYNSVTGRHGTAILNFVFKSQSRRNESNRTRAAIRELETFIIQTAIQRNQDLLNVRGRRGRDWEIVGITGSFARGRTAQSIEKYKSLMGL